MDTYCIDLIQLSTNYFCTQMRLRPLFLSQWVFALEKLVGRIIRHFFVV